MGAKSMQEQRFIDHVYDGYHAGERYCFILGAGASRSSGIRTGEQLMQEWHTFLLERGEDYIRESAEDAGLALEEYEHLLSRNAKLNNKDYFTLYDLRFAGQASAAYDALEREMEGKQPGFGYYPLSMLLTNTENKLVITTNFDSLIEDAIFIYTHKHPLVVGHESLAGFIGSNVRRPVIAKVHRDLFFSPMNRKKDMQALAEGWEKPLGNALQRYIPIVIGYAGGDRTLMTLLSKLKLKGIYWCYIGQKPDDDIYGVVEKNQGYLVKILGFDEIMFQLAERFAQEISFDDPRDDIEKQAKERCKNYWKSFKHIQMVYEKEKNEPWTYETNNMARALDEYGNRQNDGDPVNQKIVTVRRYIRERKFEEAKQECDKLIAEYPNIASFYRLRSMVFYEMRQYQDDLRDITKAIELEPDSAELYRSRSITYQALKRYEEALNDITQSIELEPNNALSYHIRSRIWYGKNELLKSLDDETKAIKIDSGNPKFLFNRGLTLHELKQYEKAMEDFDNAISLEPNNAAYYSVRGTNSFALEQYTNAIQDYEKAIALQPNDIMLLVARANIYKRMGEEEKAREDFEKAKKLGWKG